MKKFIYSLSEEELGELLARKPLALEVLQREGNTLVVASYEPLEGLSPERVEEVGEDWKDWKKGFGPVDVDDFVIMPPWKKPVFINPGMAFGTGLHPTTRLCIKLMKEYIGKGDSVLDVGTGSGVLGIVAKLLGAGRVVGIDVSEDAVRECKENAKLNKVDIECRLATPSQIINGFDLIVANLELPIFREELDKLLSLFKKSAIFSGIYREEELDEFLRMLRHRGVKVDKILEEQEWFCVGVGDAGN
ncbi:[LSU ribosomal protein L11P]-lysine N-methyltransferase [Hydrogenivirga caldilitoris]|uniref:Ribosomal protein L11 methyltransferase n=1 Tax=Hydrogenivirga caldilitoris TaxID=246264 RepID=A0A497XSP0_9AQUI|nr:50S ribosomal protein L11 methyltransferase [Hydrogenivirga caldilitoris]RLJ70142.1 [LSU ribosomal protein L11P]-lysine N-methyltransferase [Hydrogenivirga caldilitoris]